MAPKATDKASADTNKIRVGTSGFSYDAWYGTFYPDDLPKTEMLEFYAKHFDTCEINNTFYRLPTPKLVEGWAKKVPASFSFVLKASQKITHIKRLKEVGEYVDIFLKAHDELGVKTGPVLVQLPPNMKKDLSRLEAFFASVPKAVKLALEFGNPTWLDDEIYAALKARDAALVFVDAEEKKSEFVQTASFGYMRLRRVEYSRKELELWAKRVSDSNFSRGAYVFFKHEDEGTGPRFGERFQRVLGQKD